MIDNYFLKYNLTGEIDLSLPPMYLQSKIFEATVRCLHTSFNFDIDGPQMSDERVEYGFIKKETDWVFNTPKTTFNLIFAVSTKNLFLDFVFIDEKQFTKIENEHLYCMPYWMPYKLRSGEYEDQQQIMNISFETKTRPVLRINGTKW